MLRMFQNKLIILLGLLVVACAPIDDPNRLLMKEGVNKTTCSDAPYLESSYVNNYFNAHGDVVDGCEMKQDSELIFIFKQHDQSLRNHTGTIQVKITTVNLESGGAIRLFTSSNGLNESSWQECREFNNLPAGSNRVITTCDGVEIGYIKLRSKTQTSIFLDSVEVYRY
jgi:hypothetical protein